jgi:hypothetical protein
MANRPALFHPGLAVPENCRPLWHDPGARHAAAQAMDFAGDESRIHRLRSFRAGMRLLCLARLTGVTRRRGFTSLAHVAVDRAALAAFAVRFLRQRVYAAGIDPAVVEIEQRTGCDREVNRFVGPSNRVKRLHVFSRDPRRVVVHLPDETEQRLVFFVQPGGFQIAEYAPNQFFASQQFRRNCGVRLQSKRAIVAVRRVCGDQFANTGTDRRGTPKNFLSESRQVVGGFRKKREQVPDLWILFTALAHRPDGRRPGRGLVVILDIRQEHRFHNRSSVAARAGANNNGNVLGASQVGTGFSRLQPVRSSAARQGTLNTCAKLMKWATSLHAAEIMPVGFRVLRNAKFGGTTLYRLHDNLSSLDQVFSGVAQAEAGDWAHVASGRPFKATCKKLRPYHRVPMWKVPRFGPLANSGGGPPRSIDIHAVVTGGEVAACIRHGNTEVILARRRRRAAQGPVEGQGKSRWQIIAKRNGPA